MTVEPYLVTRKLKHKLYLSHCAADKKEVRNIERQLEEELGIELVNPFYDTERDPENLVVNDLEAIRSSDGLLGYITGRPNSYGTPSEIFFASYIVDLPVYLIITDEKAWNHPWLNFLATKKFSNEWEFKRWWKKHGC